MWHVISALGGRHTHTQTYQCLQMKQFQETRHMWVCGPRVLGLIKIWKGGYLQIGIEKNLTNKTLMKTVASVILVEIFGEKKFDESPNIYSFHNLHIIVIPIKHENQMNKLPQSSCTFSSFMVPMLNDLVCIHIFTYASNTLL